MGMKYIKKYIKKPSITEAFQWNGYNEEDWQQVEKFIGGVSSVEMASVDKQYGGLHIITDPKKIGGEFDSYASIGDYVVKAGYNDSGNKRYRRIVVHKPKVFELIYSEYEV